MEQVSTIIECKTLVKYEALYKLLYDILSIGESFYGESIARFGGLM